MKNAYLDQKCDRCGSKRKVSKRWKEKVPTLIGTTVVEYTQISCTNTLCQAAFEKVLAKEATKRKAIKRKKEADDAERKRKRKITQKK